MTPGRQLTGMLVLLTIVLLIIAGEIVHTERAERRAAIIEYNWRKADERAERMRFYLHQALDREAACEDIITHHLQKEK